MHPLAMLLAAARSLAFLTFIACAIGARGLALLLSKKARRRAAGARWLQWTAEGCRRILGLRVSRHGPFPGSGLLVANHLSYLDIVLLAAQHPCVFVSKSEVRAWPVFGWCASLGGTLFIDRNRRGDVSAIAGQMRAALAEGLLIVLFPEGTSSGGASVLPFRSSLLEPALQLGCPISAAAIGYSLERGSVSGEICYWRDMTLPGHLFNVFAKPVIHASLRLSPPRLRAGDRKTVARALHAEVTALHSAVHSAGPVHSAGQSPPQNIEQAEPVLAGGSPGIC